ncbi:high-affinity choline transporter [Anopheles sinensis]|uniref:High-affinity choline transporter n=1 Tax=Anopheles sinensis TaxID=74873 RepID=A0A084WLG1_ANOSI|nr:high-affinity choline transporter [Anopheles sinensis]
MESSHFPAKQAPEIIVHASLQLSKQRKNREKTIRPFRRAKQLSALHHNSPVSSAGPPCFD